MVQTDRIDTQLLLFSRGRDPDRIPEAAQNVKKQRLDCVKVMPSEYVRQMRESHASLVIHVETLNMKFSALNSTIQMLNSGFSLEN